MYILNKNKKEQGKSSFVGVRFFEFILGLGLGRWMKIVDEEGEEMGLIVIEVFLS